MNLILAAVALDLLLGDPRWLPHPVIAMGRGIQVMEKGVRRLTSSPKGLRVGGLVVTLSLVLGTYGFFWLLLWAAYQFHVVLGMVLSVLVLSQTLAVNSLYRHAVAVAAPLSRGDWNEARKNLSMIVGRDTEELGEEDIVRGVVETVSENTVDGITAPLFYAFIGGPPLAMAYKAVNTLDSMIGYKDERYQDFGWAGARLDDLANYLPARLTGLIYLLVGLFTPGGISGVWTTMRQDAPRHPSPNSGIPEAAVAGALRIQLGGLNYYRGVPSHRAVMGKPHQPLQKKHIYQSLYIMLAVTAGMLLIGAAFHTALTIVK